MVANLIYPNTTSNTVSWNSELDTYTYLVYLDAITTNWIVYIDTFLLTQDSTTTVVPTGTYFNFGSSGINYLMSDNLTIGNNSIGITLTTSGSPPPLYLYFNDTPTNGIFFTVQIDGSMSINLVVGNNNQQIISESSGQICFYATYDDSNTTWTSSNYSVSLTYGTPSSGTIYTYTSYTSTYDIFTNLSCIGIDADFGTSLADYDDLQVVLTSGPVVINYNNSLSVSFIDTSAINTIVYLSSFLYPSIPVAYMTQNKNTTILGETTYNDFVISLLTTGYSTISIDIPSYSTTNTFLICLPYPSGQTLTGFVFNPTVPTVQDGLPLQFIDANNISSPTIYIPSSPISYIFNYSNSGGATIWTYFEPPIQFGLSYGESYSIPPVVSNTPASGTLWDQLQINAYNMYSDITLVYSNIFIGDTVSVNIENQGIAITLNYYNTTDQYIYWPSQSNSTNYLIYIPSLDQTTVVNWAVYVPIDLLTSSSTRTNILANNTQFYYSSSLNYEITSFNVGLNSVYLSVDSTNSTEPLVISVPFSSAGGGFVLNLTNNGTQNFSFLFVNNNSGLYSSTTTTTAVDNLYAVNYTESSGWSITSIPVDLDFTLVYGQASSLPPLYTYTPASTPGTDWDELDVYFSNLSNVQFSYSLIENNSPVNVNIQYQNNNLTLVYYNTTQSVIWPTQSPSTNYLIYLSSFSNWAVYVPISFLTSSSTTTSLLASSSTQFYTSSSEYIQISLFNVGLNAMNVNVSSYTVTSNSIVSAVPFSSSGGGFILSLTLANPVPKTNLNFELVNNLSNVNTTISTDATSNLYTVNYTGSWSVSPLVNFSYSLSYGQTSSLPPLYTYTPASTLGTDWDELDVYYSNITNTLFFGYRTIVHCM